MLFRIKIVDAKQHVSRFEALRQSRRTSIGFQNKFIYGMCRMGAQPGAGALSFLRQEICYDWMKAVRITDRVFCARRHTAVAIERI